MVPRFTKRSVLLLLFVTLLEPVFELLLFLLHNFVFYKIIGLQFSGVSIASLFAFLAGFYLGDSLLAQYCVMLPMAFLLGLMVSFWSRYLRVGLGRWVLCASYVWLLISGIGFAYYYKILVLSNWQMIVSFTVSSLYWFCSAMLVWFFAFLLDLL